MYFKSHLLRLIGLPVLTELSNKTASFLFCTSVHIFCIFTPQYLYLCLPIFVFASHYTCKCTPLFLDPQKQAFLDKVFRLYNQCLSQSPSYFHIQPSTKRPNWKGTFDLLLIVPNWAGGLCWGRLSVISCINWNPTYFLLPQIQRTAVRLAILYSTKYKYKYRPA